MEKDIVIDGRPIRFKASAATPRIYAEMFQRDLFSDLQKIQNSLGSDGLSLEPETMRSIENLAYTMASQADPELPDIKEWLDGFGFMSIYTALPDMLELWQTNSKGTSKSQKKTSAARQ